MAYIALILIGLPLLAIAIGAPIHVLRKDARLEASRQR